MKLLAAGFALGLAAGFLLFGLPGDQPPPESPAAPPRDAGPSEATAKPPHPKDVAEATVIEQPDDVAVFREGSSAAISKLVREGEPLYTDAAVEALISRTDEARHARDWSLFVAALGGLGAANTRAADEKLLALLRDETLTFKDRMGSRFDEYLADSDLPGIADAARDRFLRNVKAGSTSWVAADGWMDIVARKGGPEEVEWLFGLTEPGGIGNTGSGQITSQVFQALASSDNPAAVKGMAERARGGKLPKQALTRFAINHPGAAYPALLRALSDRPPGTDYGGTTASNRDLLQAISGAVPEDRLREWKDRLLGISDDALRIPAVYAVERLRRRGLDISGLEPLLDFPVTYLERATVPLMPDRLYEAMYAIEYNRVAWSERAARAMEEAARRFPDHSTAEDMVKNAKLVRAGLSAPWK